MLNESYCTCDENNQKTHYLMEVKMLGLLYGLCTSTIFSTKFKCAFYQIYKLQQIKTISEQIILQIKIPCADD